MGIPRKDDPVQGAYRRTRRIELLVAMVALAGLVAAPTLGVLLASARSGRAADRRTIAGQQAAIDRLRAENESLRARPREPDVVVTQRPRPTATPSVSPAADRPLRSGQLTLGYTFCADLDSAAADWAVTNVDCGGIRDILFGPDTLQAAVALAVVPRGQDALAWCRATTEGTRALGYDQLQPKPVICVQTTERNVALLEVVAFDASPGKVTFAVTVWALYS